MFGACAKIGSSNAPDSRSACQYLVSWEGRPHTQPLKSPMRMLRSGNRESHSSSFSQWSGKNGPWMLDACTWTPVDDVRCVARESAFDGTGLDAHGGRLEDVSGYGVVDEELCVQVLVSIGDGEVITIHGSRPSYMLGSTAESKLL